MLKPDASAIGRGTGPSQIPGVAAMLVVLAGAAVLLWQREVVVLNTLWEDFFIPWEAGARWAAGQWPSVDFPSALGPLYYALHGLVFGSTDGAATTVVRANVLALILTLPVMGTVLFTRLPPLLAAAAILAFGLWMISPRQPDFSIKQLPHLASYNRHGFVWASLVLLASVLPWRFPAGSMTATRIRDLLDGAMIGLALLACLLTKASFVLPTGLFFAAATLLRFRHNWAALPRHWLAAAAVILGGLLAFELAAPGIVMAYLADLRYAASVQSEGFLRAAFGNRGEAVMFLFLDLAMAAMLFGLVIARLGWAGAFSQALPAVAVLSVLLAMMSQVHDDYGPFLPVAALVLAGGALNREAGRDEPTIRLAAITCLLIPAAVETASIGQHTLYALRAERAPDRYLQFEGTGLVLGQGAAPPLRAQAADGSEPRSSLSPVRAGTWTPEEWNQRGRLGAREFYEIWSDARLLIEQQEGVVERIFCFAFSNGCPVLTGTPPPAGLLPWWHDGRSFAIDRPPVDGLEDVELVLIPKVDRFGYADAIRQAYREVLERDFRKTGESVFWVVYRRDGNPTPVPDQMN